jgi:hypothetical protein
LRLGNGEVSPIEGFEGGFWCRKLCKTTWGKALSLSFLSLSLVMQGRARATSWAANAWAGFPNRQGRGMFNSILLSMAEPGSSDRNESFGS